jgi:3-hydroxyisobutyrate dehydrogenase-like beta-hydroxyacid dehydrogenase
VRPEATVELERLGAQRARDLKTLAETVRWSGNVIFDLSTVGPGSTKRLAAQAQEHGVRLIDAPVSGSVSGTTVGTLAVVIGATAEVAGTYEPVLKAIGTSLFYLGEVGRGNTLKLLNNLVSLPSAKRWPWPTDSASRARWWAMCSASRAARASSSSASSRRS